MNNEAVDVSSIRAMVMEDFYKNSEQRLQEQQKKITRLEENLAQYKRVRYDGAYFSARIEGALSFYHFAFYRSLAGNTGRLDEKRDTVTLAVLKFGKHPSVARRRKSAHG